MLELGIFELEILRQNIKYLINSDDDDTIHLKPILRKIETELNELRERSRQTDEWFKRKFCK
jgi:hypothetical protein